MIVACLMACTDYQGEWKDKWMSVNGATTNNSPSEEDGVMVYDTKDDLPVCSTKRNGEIVKVSEDDIFAVCFEKKWIYDVDVYETFEDAPVCSKKRIDKQIFVKDGAALYICTEEGTDRDWVEQ